MASNQPRSGYSPSRMELADSIRKGFLEAEEPIKEKKHQPATGPAVDIIRRVQARIVGCDYSGDFVTERLLAKDLDAIVTMNNVLALDTKNLQHALESGKRNAFEKFAAKGWHASKITDATLRNLLASGGYAFLLDYGESEAGKNCPLGFQFGFWKPPPPQYKSLSPNSQPEYDLFKDAQTTATIWRSGVVETLRSVRGQYEALDIAMAYDIDQDYSLRRLGAGQATKLPTAIAAQETNKQYIQFNIAQITRLNNLKDVLADNEASAGSNTEIFDEMKFLRSTVDTIVTPDGKSVAQIGWRVFFTETQEALQRLLRPAGLLKVKGWNVQQLIETGKHLARWLQTRRVV